MSLASMKKELEANQVELDSLKPELDNALKLKEDEIEKEWVKCVPQMKQFILEQLQAPGNFASLKLYLIIYGGLRR